MDRRAVLALTAGSMIAGCARALPSDGTYAVVDTMADVALSPDGSVGVIHPMWGDVNTLLLFDPEFTEPLALTYPLKNHRVQDLSFTPDGSGLLFVATPQPLDYRSRIFKLDLRTHAVVGIDVGSEICRAPTMSPDGNRLFFAGGGAGGTLWIQEYDLRTLLRSTFSAAPFQSVTSIYVHLDDALLIGGIVGVDPFDSTRRDQATGYPRAFRLERHMEPRPIPPPQDAKNMHVYGVFPDGGALLLAGFVHADRPFEQQLLRATPEGLPYRALPMGIRGIATGAALASRGGQILLRVMTGEAGDQNSEERKAVAFLNGPTVSVESLMAKARRSSMIV